MLSAAKQIPTATSARISRSRSSMRCDTKGCSVPSSSSRSGGVALNASPAGGSSRRARRGEGPHARGARQRLGANAVALLVPLRRGTALHAPVLLRMTVFEDRRRGIVRRGCTGLAWQRRHVGRGLLPRAVEIGGGAVDLLRDALLDVARRVLELRLHLLEVLELDR